MSNDLNAPWVQKYRPKTVQDIAHQDEVVRALEKSLESGNLPHLLFYGPPGTGKTSTIHAIARQLYGPNLIKQRVKELNASDDRGINVVRSKIKTFAKLTARAAPNGKYPCPPYKIIILDEADSMTYDAQAALRRTMELYSGSTRFCFICNYVSRIIDPLTSRCAKFRFKPLESSAMVNRLEYIAKEEGFSLPSDVYETIVDLSAGDMRKAITFLQTGYRFCGEDLDSDKITSLSGEMPLSQVDSIIEACKGGVVDKLQKAVADTIAEGFSGAQILEKILDLVIDWDVKQLDDQCKAEVIIALGAADKSLLDGSDDYLQVLKCTSTLMKYLTV